MLKHVLRQLHGGVDSGAETVFDVDLHWGPWVVRRASEEGRSVRDKLIHLTWVLTLDSLTMLAQVPRSSETSQLQSTRVADTGVFFISTKCMSQL